MPLIDYPKMDDLDAETRGILEQMKTPGGALPAFPRLLANNPRVLKAALGQFSEVIYGGEVDLDLKQLAFVTVSQVNRSSYCAATHGQELVERLGYAVADLSSLIEGTPAGFTDRQRAVVGFARQAATDPRGVGREHVDALRESGLDDADIVEVLAAVAQASFANTVVDVMDVLPVDQDPELLRYYPQGAS